MTDEIIKSGLLVAYADDELDSEQRRVVESALESDENLVIELKKLKETGSILRSALETTHEKAPEHIAHKILQLDAATDTQKHPGSSPTFIEKILKLIYASIGIFKNPRYITLGGTFASGLLCAVLVSNITSLDFSSKDDNFVIVSSGVTRGGASEELSFILPSAVQEEAVIFDEGTLLEGKSFRLSWRSPIDGVITVFEVNNQIRKEVFTQTIQAGESLKMPQLVVTDQSYLQLQIEVSNTSTIITNNLRFKISPR